jgi:hypothetical protein
MEAQQIRLQDPQTLLARVLHQQVQIHLRRVIVSLPVRKNRPNNNLRQSLRKVFPFKKIRVKVQII